MVAGLFKDRLIACPSTLACASTLAYLFVTCQSPASRACATYSPWLFTSNFVQTGFYLGITLYNRAVQRNHWRSFLFVGLVLGLTFLGHSAPALILGGIIAFRAVWISMKEPDRTLSSPRLHETIVQLGIVVGTALVVGLPYVRITGYRYRMHALNPAPINWVFSELELASVLTLIRANLAWPNLVALAGLAFLWARPRDRSASLFTLWLVICLAFAGLSYLSQLASRLDLPRFQVVPSIHFLFYIKALVSALFGYGLLAIVRFALEFGKYLRARLRECLSDGRQARVERAAPVLLALAVAFGGYGSFVRQPAFNGMRDRAQTDIPPGWRNA